MVAYTAKAARTVEAVAGQTSEAVTGQTGDALVELDDHMDNMAENMVIGKDSLTVHDLKADQLNLTWEEVQPGLAG